MRNILGFLFFVFASIANAQSNSETVSKRVVKVKDEWFVETRTVKVEHQKIDFDILYSVENDSLEDAQDLVLIEQLREERRKRKEERAERNRLLRDALRRGYDPDKEALTIEEKARIDKIKAKLK